MVQALRSGRWDGQRQRNNGVARSGSGWSPKGKRPERTGFSRMKKGAFQTVGPGDLVGDFYPTQLDGDYKKPVFLKHFY